MADELIVLPSSVESLLHEISSEQSQPLPNTPARSKLAALGEEASLRILSQIRTSKIKTSFDGFIFYLAKEHRSPGSPAPVALPAAVEELITTICKEQSQPPLGANAKRKLAEIGEEDALQLLCTARKAKIDRSFDGFVMCFNKNNTPVSPKQQTIFSSPSPRASITAPSFLDGVAHPAQDRFTLSPISTSRLSGGPSILPCSYNQQAYRTTSVGIPNEQTFSSPTNAGKPDGQCLALSPNSAPRQPGGPLFSPCSYKQHSYLQTPSPTNGVGIPNGQMPSPTTNVGKLNAKCLTFSPISAARQPGEFSHTTNAGIPSGHTFCSLTNTGIPSEQSISLTSNVGIPSVHTFSLSTNVGNPNGQCCIRTTIMNSNEQALVPSSNPWNTSGQTSGPLLQASNAQAFVPSTDAQNPSAQTSGSVLEALQELEFRKAFLILNYIGRSKLEQVTSANEIRELAAAQSTMGAFEDKIWHKFGSRHFEEKDRVKEVDWESGRIHYYHCFVDSDGSYSFKGPFLNKTATLLQKVLGDENVLIVKFHKIENFSLSVSMARVCDLAREGIFVGLKRFRFFVFKDGGKDEKQNFKDGGKEEKQNSSSGAIKAYYINVDSLARFYENRASCFRMMSLHDQRCIFMHVHNTSSLSAYMARFSLILSKTITLGVNLDDPDVHVEVIEDMPCKDVNGIPIYDKDGKLQIHTDGTGYISEELAIRCPHNCFKGTSLNDRFFERYLEIVQPGTSTSQFKPDKLQPPLLIQFRMFHNGRAVKGTVLVNKKLHGKRIQIRPSMIKVEPDPVLSLYPAVNSFEIVTTSTRPRKPRLSRYLIALLSYGGVPRDFFIRILVNEIWDARNIFTNKRAALKAAVNHGGIDDKYLVARMILSGIPLDESYIQLRLPFFGQQEHKSLKEGKLPIQDSIYVMGTADPTGCLNSNEVCIIHENGQLEGKVLVYRSPGVHFGDVHILKATRVKGLEDIVGASKYGIFFPINGPRSLADKMAGGDYDGDMYFVSWHPTLVELFKQSEPWSPTALCGSRSFNKKPFEFSAEKLEHQLFCLFLTTRFEPCKAASKAADSWLAYMDQMLSTDDEQKVDKQALMNKILKLVDIYYEALDAPKKGQKVEVLPELIPKSYPHFMGRGKHYNSTSILGEIFDKANELQIETLAIEVGKLPRFEIEVPLQYILLWEAHYECYKNEMSEALGLSNESGREAASDVNQKYKQILYGDDEFEKSPKAWEEIRFEALGLYHVVYSHAMQMKDVRKCGFAWKVAGPALMKIYMEEQDEKPLYCLPSVLRQIL